MKWVGQQSQVSVNSSKPVGYLSALRGDSCQSSRGTAVLISAAPIKGLEQLSLGSHTSTGQSSITPHHFASQCEIEANLKS